MRKIVITGPESTGKTTLARQLGEHFKVPWVPEYAREYLDRIARPYRESDLLEIAKGQWAREQAAALAHSSWLFFDTDLRVIKIWSEVKYGRTHPWILEKIALTKYHLYLLMDIDLGWRADPQREHPFERERLMRLYKQEIAASGFPYKIIQGIHESRFQQALQALQTLPL